MAKHIIEDSDYILRLENLNKIFDNNFEVVKNVNLNVKKGEFVIVHAGFAIEKVSEENEEEIAKLLNG